MLIHVKPAPVWAASVYIAFSVAAGVASSLLPIETKDKELDDVVDQTLLAFENHKHKL